jgi:hypothetical protein
MNSIGRQIFIATVEFVDDCSCNGRRKSKLNFVVLTTPQCFLAEKNQQERAEKIFKGFQKLKLSSTIVVVCGRLKCRLKILFFEVRG